MPAMPKVSEKLCSQNILKALEPHFFIEEQVRGLHFTGKKMIIDAILKPRNAANWANTNVALGVEFKSTDNIREDARKFTGWVAQCVDYAETEWNGHGYVHVFTCPGIEVEDLPLEFRDRKVKRFAERMMSQFGVGSLRNDEYLGTHFILQGDHVVWSERYGVQHGKTWKMERKHGSR